MSNDKLKRKIRDYIFIGAASIVIYLGFPILIDDLNSTGDWEGLASIWLLIVIILPISLLIFIPWLIWFIFQYIKYRNEIVTRNTIPLLVTTILFAYIIVHYSLMTFLKW